MASIKYKTEDGYVSIPMTVPTKSNEENGNGIGTCDTSSGTALAVTLNGYELVANGFVAVTFENDVPAGATLNVNNKGAKPIIYKGSAIEADVIKADDTVTFCYDGNSYVVTSLGGGGGTIVWPEFVTISLTQSGGSDSDLIGATVVVSDDDTSETILSTTWQGELIALQIDSGINYTVTVGNVNDYIIRQNTQSYTAQEGLSRTASFVYWGGFMDLGLPSGVLWATKNIGATSPEKYGLYFSYGNIVGHNLDGPSTGEYEFSQVNYVNTTGASLTGDYPSGNSLYDAATAYNPNYRIPTINEVNELINNTTVSVTTMNGVSGFLLTSKITGYTDRSIFIPKSGIYVDNSSRAYTSWAFLHMTKYGNVGFHIDQNGANSNNTVYMHYGYAVRPVLK